MDTGYATIDFPFDALSAPALEIRLDWQLSEFLGYLQTWSAVRNAREAGQEAVLLSFAHEISAAWGDGNTRRSIAWPINMRIGRL